MPKNIGKTPVAVLLVSATLLFLGPAQALPEQGPKAPTDLQVHHDAETDLLHLIWSGPSDLADVTYNVYRNGRIVATVQDATFAESTPTLATYMVTTVTIEGESAPAGPVTVLALGEGTPSEDKAWPAPGCPMIVTNGPSTRYPFVQAAIIDQCMPEMPPPFPPWPYVPVLPPSEPPVDLPPLPPVGTLQVPRQ